MYKWPYLLIASGGVLWGLIGIFVRGLDEAGFTPLQVVTLRALSATTLLVVYLYAKDRSLLKINPRDSIYFVGTGILSIVFFNWCYFTTISLTSLSIAVILLYTAPAFVVIISRIVFKEQLTARKILSLFLTLLGCALVVGVAPGSSLGLAPSGLLIGLGAGLGYALYSIFGKMASAKYNAFTVTTFTFIFAGVALLPVSQLWANPGLFRDPNVWLLIIGLGLFPTVLAYILYTAGLAQIESSRASITASIEPMVATMTGIFLYNEVLTWWQLGGMLLILAAITTVQEKRVKPNLETKDGRP